MDIKFYEIINQLNEYMRQKQLPKPLKKRILEYYSFKYQRKYLKEELITSLLSGNSFHIICSFLSVNLAYFQSVKSFLNCRVLHYELLLNSLSNHRFEHFLVYVKDIMIIQVQRLQIEKQRFSCLS